jgi:hypothetical protein
LFVTLGGWSQPGEIKIAGWHDREKIPRECLAPKAVPAAPVGPGTRFEGRRRWAAMFIAAAGEHIARAGSGPHVRDCAGAETLEGSLCSPLGACVQGPEESQARADRYSAMPVRSTVPVLAAKRVRGDRAKSRSRLSRVDPRRAKPKGATGGRRAKPMLGRSERSEGLKPGNRGPRDRPSAPAEGIPVGATVGGCICAVTPRDLLRCQAPKGESHERCRRETKPARIRGE